MMVFKILKLFGLDVPAKLEAAKLDVEHRVEEVVDRFRHAAMEAAIIAALSAVAAFAAALAVIVGLVAMYDWEAPLHGALAALGIDGALLVAVIVICGIFIAVKSRSLAAARGQPTRAEIGTAAAVAADPDEPAMLTDAAGGDRGTRTSWTKGGYYGGISPGSASRLSAEEAVTTLEFFLSKVFRFPTVGVPAVDDLMGSVKATARHGAEDAIERVGDVVEHGDRATLVFVLSGAVLAGWVLSHRSLSRNRN